MVNCNFSRSAWICACTISSSLSCAILPFILAIRPSSIRILLRSSISLRVFCTSFCRSFTSRVWGCSGISIASISAQIEVYSSFAPRSLVISGWPAGIVSSISERETFSSCNFFSSCSIFWTFPSRSTLRFVASCANLLPIASFSLSSFDLLVLKLASIFSLVSS